MDAPHCLRQVRPHELARRSARPGALPPQVATEYDRYLYRVRSFVDSARLRMPRLPRVYADFVQNPLFDARAFRVDGLHLIVIYAGMPVVTTAVVRRMLADRRLLRHVGDPRLEADNLPRYARITPNANELFKTITLTSPKDDSRVIYSHHLQNTVYDFLAAHELTHIAHGHVRYMSPEQDQPVPNEDRWMPRTPEGNLESQTMEMDADFNAAKLMMQHIDRLWKEHATLPPPLNEYYADRTRAVYDLAAAINIMCRLFGDKTFTGVDLDRSRHPPMAWRQMWMMNTLGNNVEHLWGEELVKPGEEAISKALSDVEMAFAVITGCIMSVAGLEEAFGPIGRAYGRKLSDCWNDSLKAKLAKHSYIDGAMPHFGFDFDSALSQIP